MARHKWNRFSATLGLIFATVLHGEVKVLKNFTLIDGTGRSPAASTAMIVDNGRVHAAIIHDHCGGSRGRPSRPINQCEILQHLDFAVEYGGEDQAEGGGKSIPFVSSHIEQSGSKISSFELNAQPGTDWSTIATRWTRMPAVEGNLY